MAQENPVATANQPKRVRIAEMTFSTYEQAKQVKDLKQVLLGGKKIDVSGATRYKIFARQNGSFDGVWYKEAVQPPSKEPQYASKAQERRAEKLKGQHDKK